MSALFTLIYATHANGTHHKLALDALRHLDRPDAEAWRRVFLKHVVVFLEGSKAPDNEFKDFKNHVLHVRDNYWGGAPDKVQNWYIHTVDALRDGDWARATYAAGVLSHYYTDPIHPFHTQQSQAENNIHRAAEWSINRSYNDLRKQAEAAHAGLVVRAPDGETWLKELVCQGAEKSNANYETLIAHYDIHRGVVDPPAGLDALSRAMVAELIMYASKGFAVILDRAIADSGAQAPDVSLSIDMVLATLKAPLKWVTKKIDDAETRRLVERMYDELKATGRVEVNLPEDDRRVRDLYAKEVLAPRAAGQAAARAAKLPSKPAAPKATSVKPAAQPPAANARDATSSANANRTVVAPVAETRPAAAPAAASVPSGASGRTHDTPVPVVAVKPTVTSVPSAGPAVAPARDLVTPRTMSKSAPAPTPLAKESLSSLSRPPRVYLAEIDDVEAAPSIGPKMAERLAAAGIKTVADLLQSDPDAAVAVLGDRRITAETIRDWQDQAQLVMSVPGLRGTHAQLLVGAGFRTAAALAATDPSTLSSEVLEFAITDEGARVLRSGDTPDLEAITRWIESARLAIAA